MLWIQRAVVKLPGNGEASREQPETSSLHAQGDQVLILHLTHTTGSHRYCIQAHPLCPVIPGHQGVASALVHHLAAPWQLPAWKLLNSILTFEYLRLPTCCNYTNTTPQVRGAGFLKPWPWRSPLHTWEPAGRISPHISTLRLKARTAVKCSG